MNTESIAIQAVRFAHRASAVRLPVAMHACRREVVEHRMVEVLEILVCGLAAGTLGGLLGIGGGIVLMPFLRFCVGLSPAYAAGTCIVAVFCTTLSGSYRHHRLGHVDIGSVLPVMAAGVAATAVFSFAFLWMSQR